jgi:uncharacterized membrane protein SpoIIM required for sporulation
VALHLPRRRADPLPESLIGRAASSPTQPAAARRPLKQFWPGWPAAVRRRWRALALATFNTAIGFVTADVLTRGDRDSSYSFIGDMAQNRTPASSTAELRAGLYDTGNATSMLASFAAGFTPHARIGILVLALGCGSACRRRSCSLQRPVLGAFVALYTSRGLGVDVWAWLLPHGVTELGAVILCGAAGFTIAGALAFPGARSRLDNLRDHGHDAARIVAGCVVMLFVAGLIEGIFRQTVTSVPIRYRVAADRGRLG